MIERLLVVGLGSIGRRHARLARQLLPQLEIVALRHRGCAEGSEPGIDRCVPTLDEALRLRPQAAVIASPSSQHLTVALGLARAGVHLMVEKPLADTSNGVPELIEVASSAGVLLMTGYNLRYLPSLRFFRDTVLAQRVGRILSVRAEVGQYLPSWRPATDYRESVSAQAALGGGALLELSHDIDLLLWTFGRIESVSAAVTTQGELQIDVEDSAHLTLRFEETGSGVPLVATLNMDFIRHDTTRQCTAIGEQGTVRWNAISGVVELFEAGATEWKTLFADRPDRDASYIAELTEFFDCVSDGRPPLVNGADGLAVLRVIEAARRSSESRSAACAVNYGESARFDSVARR